MSDFRYAVRQLVRAPGFSIVPAFTAYKAATASLLTDVAAISDGGFSISSDGDALRVDGAYVSAARVDPMVALRND